MTISTIINRKEYTGNGVTTSFSFPYSVLAAADLKVYQAGTLKTITTHYTLSGTAPYTSGTNVQFVTAPAAAEAIVILRDPAITQSTDLIENDALPAEELEKGYDRLTMISQRLSDRLDRSFHLADTDVSGALLAVPTPVASNLVGWDAAGTELINYTALSVGVTGVSAFAATLLDDTTAAIARTTLGAAGLTDNNTLSGNNTHSGTETFNGSVQNLITGICEGRLTLTTAVPVTTADVTGATTVYFTPYKGNRIALYDGSANWKLYNFTEKSLALGTLTSGLPYDVFIYDNAGTLTLEFLAWTNTTTRATALATQDGVYVKTGATTRRYLGSFFTTATTTTEDSAAKRYLFNYYNRVFRKMQAALETTDSWTYTTATWRQANANTANQLNFLVGIVEDAIEANVTSLTAASGGVGIDIGVGIGLNSTTAWSGLPGTCSAIIINNIIARHAKIHEYPALGLNYAAWLEYSQASGTTTWYGDQGQPTILQSGIIGSMQG